MIAALVLHRTHKTGFGGLGLYGGIAAQINSAGSAATAVATRHGTTVVHNGLDLPRISRRKARAVVIGRGWILFALRKQWHAS